MTSPATWSTITSPLTWAAFRRIDRVRPALPPRAQATGVTAPRRSDAGALPRGQARPLPLARGPEVRCRDARPRTRHRTGQLPQRVGGVPTHTRPWSPTGRLADMPRRELRRPIVFDGTRGGLCLPQRPQDPSAYTAEPRLLQSRRRGCCARSPASLIRRPRAAAPLGVDLPTDAAAGFVRAVS